MTATRSDIERWLDTAKKNEATHLIVAVDRFNYDNYPVYIGPGEDITEELQKIRDRDMQGIDEVYNMKMDINEQLDQSQAYNL